MTQLEEELTRTFAEAALAAPDPDNDFLAGVRRRQRIRQRRRGAAMTACAVALTAVASVTAVAVARPQLSPAVPSTWNGRGPDFSDPTSAEKVFPDAVRRLPGRLPDGREYQVVDVIDNDSYLVTTIQYSLMARGEGQDRPDRTGPSVFDVKSNTVLGLFDPNPPAGPNKVVGMFTAPAVVGEHVVWVADVQRPQGAGFEVWSSRLDGVGGPRRLVALPENAMPHIGLVGQAVYWNLHKASGTGSAGLYRMPVSGGTPELIQGSEGYAWAFLGASPWVTTKPEVPKGQNEENPREGELWNLATGERRAWVANPRARFITCDPVLCRGQTSDGNAVVQQLDGNGLQTLPYADAVELNMSSTLEGRFGVGTVYDSGSRWTFAWDRFTGKVAMVDPRPEDRSPPFDQTASAESTLSGHTATGFESKTVQWPDGKDGFYLLDLRKIR